MVFAKTSISLIAASLMLVSGAAHARPVSGSAIVYRGSGPAPATAPVEKRIEDVATARIMFRYPGTAAGMDSSRPEPRVSAATLPARQDAGRPVHEPVTQGPILTDDPVIAESFDLATSPVRVTAAPSAPSAPAQFASLTTDPFAASVSTATHPVTVLPGAQGLRPSQPLLSPGTTASQPASIPAQVSSVVARPGARPEEQTGLVGVYPDGYEGQPTANGETYKASAMTAAHPTLPLPSLVHITNDRTGQDVVVRVNDRGPFYGMGDMEISAAAAAALGYAGQTPETLRFRYLGPAPVGEAAPPADPRPAVGLSNVADDALAAPAPTQPVMAEASAEPPATSGPTYFIQAGSFADIGNAQRLSQGLDRGLPVEIQQVRVHESDFFRVMVGPFPTRSEAMLHRDQLDAAGIADGYIRTQ